MTCTRFAPSPTGNLHIGGARTALYNWLWARKNNGRFILRIEDTDLERSTTEATEAIFEAMSWLGLGHDGEVPYQSKRMDRYKEVTDKLLAEGKAYHCHCSVERLDELREQQRASGQKPKYDGHCREQGLGSTDNSVIRLKRPTEGLVEFKDEIFGEQQINQAELDDFVMVRTGGMPTYNFTVVVDDIDMEMTHVIRGDDHLSNTPKQVNLYNALGAKPPIFVHVPMILGADGKRLSKRHGAVAVQQYRDEGILPEALLNYLLRLGFSDGDKELFTIDEMVQSFALNKLNRAAATFDPAKLRWVNQQKILAMSDVELAKRVAQFCLQMPTENLEAVCGVYKERATTLKDFVEQTKYLYTDDYEVDDKSTKLLVTENLGMLQTLADKLAGANWSVDGIKDVINEIMAEQGVGFGKVAQPLRAATCGVANTPGLPAVLVLLGQAKTMERIQRAVENIAKST